MHRVLHNIIVVTKLLHYCLHFIKSLLIISAIMAASEAEQEIAKREAMFGQISSIINGMLESLAGVYQANQLDYSVAHYHPILMRILSPIEIKNKGLRQPLEFYYNHSLK